MFLFFLFVDKDKDLRRVSKQFFWTLLVLLVN